MIEYSKIGFQRYLQEKKVDNLLMSRPEFAVSNKLKTRTVNKKLIGIPATEAVIKHGLELIAAFLEDY